MIKNLAGEWGMFNEEWLIEKKYGSDKIKELVKKNPEIYFETYSNNI